MKNMLSRHICVTMATLFLSLTWGELFSQERTGRVEILDSSKVTAFFVRESHGGRFIYTPERSFNTISVVGEPDVLRHITSLPGVSQGMEGTLGMFVRGGGNGGNVVDLNGIPIGTTTHLLGMFSVFSPDIVSSSSFYSGGFPSKFGNTSSSLTVIELTNALDKGRARKVSVSLYLTGVYVSEPLVRDRFGVQMSIRYSPLPFLGKQVLRMMSSEDNWNAGMGGTMYDCTMTADWKLSKGNCLDFMVFASKDRLLYTDDLNGLDIGWNTRAFKVGWKSDFSKKVRVESKAYYTGSGANETQTYYWEQDQSWKSSEMTMSNQRSDLSFQSNVFWSVRDNLSLSGGVCLSHQTFNPANRVVGSGKTDRFNKQDSTFNYVFFRMNMLALFGEVGYSLNRKLRLNAGFRSTYVSSENDSRNNVDLHGKIDYWLTDRLGLETTFDRMTRYQHTLEGLPVGWALDVSLPCSDIFPEEITNQGYCGVSYKKLFHGSRMNLNLGGYYRSMNNLLS